MANKPGMEPLEPDNFQYEEFLSDLHKNIFNNKSTVFNYQKQKEYEPIDVTPVTVLNIHYSRNMKTFNFSYYYIIQNTLSDHYILRETKKPLSVFTILIKKNNMAQNSYPALTRHLSSYTLLVPD